MGDVEGADECQVGQILASRWRIRRRVGKGTFSEIYEASDLHQERGADGRHPHVAVKVARGDSQKRSMLSHEEDVLRALQPCSAVPRFVERGQDSACSFIVMQLLGENLSNMRRLTTNKCLSLQTALLLCVQMVDALEAMHDLGYIHRDIKPSNCCIGLNDDQICFLLDFGLVCARPPLQHGSRMHLTPPRKYICETSPHCSSSRLCRKLQKARRWKTEAGKLRPARATAEFRGTCRYASIHSHQHEELGRRDDLWSLVYMLLELHGGLLPWHSTRNHDEVLHLKKQHMSELLHETSDGAIHTAGICLPSAFLEILRHLDRLAFEDKPDYTLIRNALLRCLPDPHRSFDIDWSAEGIAPDMRHILRSRAGRDGATMGTAAPVALIPLVTTSSSAGHHVEDGAAIPASCSGLSKPSLEIALSHVTGNEILVDGIDARRSESWIRDHFESWIGPIENVAIRGIGVAALRFADAQSALVAAKAIHGQQGMSVKAANAVHPHNPTRQTSSSRAVLAARVPYDMDRAGRMPSTGQRPGLHSMDAGYDLGRDFGMDSVRDTTSRDIGGGVGEGKRATGRDSGNRDVSARDVHGRAADSRDAGIRERHSRVARDREVGRRDARNDGRGLTGALAHNRGIELEYEPAIGRDHLTRFKHTDDLTERDINRHRRDSDGGHHRDTGRHQWRANGTTREGTHGSSHENCREHRDAYRTFHDERHERCPQEREPERGCERGAIPWNEDRGRDLTYRDPPHPRGSRWSRDAHTSEYPGPSRSHSCVGIGAMQQPDQGVSRARNFQQQQPALEVQQRPNDPTKTLPSARHSMLQPDIEMRRTSFTSKLGPHSGPDNVEPKHVDSQTSAKCSSATVVSQQDYATCTEAAQGTASDGPCCAFPRTASQGPSTRSDEIASSLHSLVAQTMTASTDDNNGGVASSAFTQEYSAPSLGATGQMIAMSSADDSGARATFYHATGEISSTTCEPEKCPSDAMVFTASPQRDSAEQNAEATSSTADMNIMRMSVEIGHGASDVREDVRAKVPDVEHCAGSISESNAKHDEGAIDGHGTSIDVGIDQSKKRFGKRKRANELSKLIDSDSSAQLHEILESRSTARSVTTVNIAVQAAARMEQEERAAAKRLEKSVVCERCSRTFKDERGLKAHSRSCGKNTAGKA